MFITPPLGSSVPRYIESGGFPFAPLPRQVKVGLKIMQSEIRYSYRATNVNQSPNTIGSLLERHHARD